MSENLNKLDNYYDSLINQIKDIDTEKIPTNIDRDVKNRVVEKQKTYIWLRVYLKEEMSDLKIGDMFEITYEDEKLLSQFIAFGKKNLHRDKDNIINYDPEEDKKQLCLMVDQDSLTSNVRFIRSLFRSTPYFEYQVYKRGQLLFTNQRTNISCDYLDADF